MVEDDEFNGNQLRRTDGKEVERGRWSGEGGEVDAVLQIEEDRSGKLFVQEQRAFDDQNLLNYFAGDARASLFIERTLVCTENTAMRHKRGG